MNRLIAAVLLLALTNVGNAQDYTVFTNVNVLTMLSDEVLENQTVVVRGHQIFDLGDDTITIPDDAEIIDGTGKFLMPGLAEMHGHTPIPGGDPTSQFVNDMMFLYAANGVTTVRGMLGAAGQLELKTMVQRGELIGPTLYLAGPSFSGNSINSPQQAEARVRQQVEQGWDLLKVHPGLTLEEYDAMARTARELGIRWGGHVPAEVGLHHAIRMGQHTFDHIDGYLEALGAPQREIDSQELLELARLSKNSGVWIVPTQALWEYLRGAGDPDAMIAWPELQYWPENQVNNWLRSVRSAIRNEGQQALAITRARDQVLLALQENGVGILMGTDSPQVMSVPGFSIHREMQAMVEAGMSNYEVLVSGTRNVGIYLQGKEAFGVISPGQRADLILLNSNPLLDIAAVADRAGVMVRGRWLPEDRIQARLAEIAENMN